MKLSIFSPALISWYYHILKLNKNLLNPLRCHKSFQVAVDEILKALQVPPIENKGSKLYNSQIEYWQEVKEEIEKL
jgi:hypothetical protein